LLKWRRVGQILAQSRFFYAARGAVMTCVPLLGPESKGILWVNARGSECYLILRIMRVRQGAGTSARGSDAATEFLAAAVSRAVHMGHIERKDSIMYDTSNSAVLS
jgi:hypothetical protein